MVLADSRKASPTPRYSGITPAPQVYTCTGLSPPTVTLPRVFHFNPKNLNDVNLQPPKCRNKSGLGSSPAARRYQRSEEHTSELQHVAISYAVFCLQKKMSTT